MTRLRALVLEDEWPARNYLVQLIEETRLAEVVGAVACVGEAREALAGLPVDVVFVDVQLSDAARRVLEALVSALRTVPWMSWDRFDAENLHPHMTIVERCRPRFAEVWELLKTRERRFTAWFDNITLLKKVGERDGMDLWTIHRAFNLEA